MQTLNERALIFVGTNPGIIKSPTTISTSPLNATLLDARLMEVIVTIGMPITGSPSVQARWRDSPDGILFSEIAQGPVIALIPGMYVARLDTSFLRSRFIELQLEFTGQKPRGRPGAKKSKFPMSAHWLVHDLQQSPPRVYDEFPTMRPTELVVVDTTMRGDNR